jgi:heptosyltransferase-1
MIDRLIVINKDEWKRSGKALRTVKEIGALLKELKLGGYDLAVDLQGLLRSGVITMASRAPVRIGFSEAREGSRRFYTERVEGGKGLHAVDRYLRIAAALGCDTGKIVFPFPPLKEQTEKRIGELLKDHRDYVVLVPGARWQSKIWPAERFGEVAAMLPLKSVVIGSRADTASAEEIVRASGGKAISLAGKTSLGELTGVMKGARGVISNDSGPMHIAAALGVPVAAIFGATSAVLTGPYGKGHIIISSEVSCSPCFRRRCDKLECMEEITALSVFEKLEGKFFGSNISERRSL